MSRTIALVAAALVVVSTVAHPVSAQIVDSCGGGCPTPPKNFRAVSANGVVLATYPGNTLTATLQSSAAKDGSRPSPRQRASECPEHLRVAAARSWHSWVPPEVPVPRAL